MKNLLIIMLIFLTGCGVFNYKKPVQSLKYKETKVLADKEERQLLTAEKELIESTKKQLSEAHEILSKLWALKPELNELKQVLILLSRSKVSVQELNKCVDSQINVKGEAEYQLDLTSENLEYLRKTYEKTQIEAEEQETKAFDIKFGKSPLSGVWGILKFIILGVLITGSVIATIYIRLVYGEILGLGTGILSAAITFGYLWFSYQQFVITVAVLLICFGGLAALGWLLWNTFKSKQIIEGVEKVKKSLPPDYVDVLESILSIEYPDSTKRFVKKIKKSNKI